MTIGDEKVVAWLTEWKSPECGTVYRGAYVELANARNVQDIRGDSITPLIPHSAYAELAAELASEREKSGKFFGIAYDTQTKLDAAESQLAELRATLQGIADANYQEWDDGLNTPFAFVTWAKSRAAHAISTLAAADGDTTGEVK